jgi:hypothetical protein
MSVNLRCSLNVSDQVSHPYKPTDRIALLYILISYTSVGTMLGHVLEEWDTGVGYLSESEHYVPLLKSLDTFLGPLKLILNPLTPNDPCRDRTAPVTSKVEFLFIYSTNIDTEYFKHGTYFPLFSLQNAVCFIILTYLVPVLFIFYMQDVLKLKI